MLSEHRNETAASAFFARAIETNGWPEKTGIDKSGASLAGLQNINWLLLLHGWFWLIEILQVKELNNMIEQDHPVYQEADPPHEGLQILWSASATRDGIEVAHMIRKHQFSTSGQSAFQEFAARAA